MAPASLTLVNGSPAGALAADDRGLAFGDGVFRTLRMEAGEPLWWDDHYAKLVADCRLLSIDCPARPDWQQDLAWIAARLPDAVVKLLVTRGPAPRGYRVPDTAWPSRIALATPLPAFPDPVREAGAVLRLCDLRLGHQPRLAGAKHLNRLENVLARMEWDSPDIDEGLLLDQDGRVVSGVMSNLFARVDGAWLTPDLSRCGVAGVTRGRLLGQLGARITDLALGDIERADAVLLCNSLIRVRWVARLAERTWTKPDMFDSCWRQLC